MVAPVPPEKNDHDAFVKRRRREDGQTPDIESSRTLTGPEAIERESNKMHTLLTQLRGQPHVRRRVYELFQDEAAGLQREVKGATEHNTQFVLAENMRSLNHRIEDLLAP
ncbi:hypothetical protein AUJ46_03235 [Candidatus Peregrinibacteria bacterium CG1_02_54_53]|nr:MAG: hypothetical protein AUJ46_03235 [Candidatus Peregrinibacteria bacterium CG1_02_54_53]